jgi:ribosomal protein L37AE/L43A
MAEPIEVIDESAGEVTEVHQNKVETTAMVPAQTTYLQRYSPAEVRDQVNYIQTIMKDVMHKDEHYGVIPGTQKPKLFKAGAEKLCLSFRLQPEYTTQQVNLPDGHREYTVSCTMRHIGTGTVLAAGVVGVCSSLESRYRYRKAFNSPTCPDCGHELRKSKQENEWYCWRKQGGCGATFPGHQFKANSEKIENPDPADCYNTIAKMAQKRALVAATLIATGASDIFSQDLEDMPEFQPDRAAGPPPEPSQPARREQRTAPPQAQRPPAQQQQRTERPDPGPPDHVSRRPATRPADSRPPRLEAQGTQVFVPANIVSKEGETNGKAWKKLTLTTVDGHEFTYFGTDGFGSAVTRCFDGIEQGHDARLRITWQADRRGQRAKKIELVMPSKQAESTGDEWPPEDTPY